MTDLKAGLLRLRDHQDVACRGGRHDPVALVQVEVAAAAEIRERVAAAHRARRQWEGRQRLERVGVEEREHGPVEADADRDESPWESNVIDAHSRANRAESVTGSTPRGRGWR
jgi:hypothetical protein